MDNHELQLSLELEHIARIHALERKRAESRCRGRKAPAFGTFCRHILQMVETAIAQAALDDEELSFDRALEGALIFFEAAPYVAPIPMGCADDPSYNWKRRVVQLPDPE